MNPGLSRVRGTVLLGTVPSENVSLRQLFDAGVCIRSTKTRRMRPCSRCHLPNPRWPDQRYCALCRNATMRESRARNGSYAGMTMAEKVKVIARSYLRVYVRRGKIIRPDNCERCGIACKPHGHHHDYALPLDVVWLCPPCHRAEHPQRNKKASRPYDRDASCP